MDTKQTTPEKPYTDQQILSNGTCIYVHNSAEDEYTLYIRGRVAFKGNSADMVALRFFFERAVTR